jgi:soluble lytic murein transglycosylase
LAAVLLMAMVGLSAPAQCQDGAEWDRARAALKALAPGAIAPAITRWRQLTGTENLGFDAYAGFVLAWPGFPQEEALRRAAEKSLAIQNIDTARQVAFFDRFPPLTNPARASYALALAAQGRGREAADVARAAWRGGAMSDAAETAIAARWGNGFALDDHNARLEALLWDGSTAQALRAMGRAAPARRAIAMARIALQQGAPNGTPATQPDATDQGAARYSNPAPNGDDASEMARVTALANPGLSRIVPGGPAETLQIAAPLPVPGAATPDMLGDPGYLADRARFLLRHGRGAEAASLLATRPVLTRPALDPRRWTAVNLAAARLGGPSDTLHISMSASEGFPPGADVSQQNFAVRDDYTSLMWLGATTALWQLHNGPAAAQLFWRYATAARTPMTRAKGFYWAGRALTEAGQANDAARYFTSASQYPDQYYGLLALERLGRPIPPLHDAPHTPPTDAQRAEFAARPIAQAVREVARDADWPTTIRFFREISGQAKTEADFVAVADFAKSLGRRDLAVVAGQAAQNAGLANFRDLAFPLIPVPAGGDWTWTHAITRQESQFSQNALSHSGARGLMQLMPSTAAEQARKLGLPASTTALSDDPAYNLTLGSAYFTRLLNGFHGSYPLAVAAYNAGPGNVAHWLRERGDPRSGAVDWVEWIERIPVAETRGYVAHVLENAVTYEAMNPDHAAYKGANPVSHYIGKPTPG